MDLVFLKSKMLGKSRCGPRKQTDYTEEEEESKTMTELGDWWIHLALEPSSSRDFEVSGFLRDPSGKSRTPTWSALLKQYSSYY